MTSLPIARYPVRRRHLEVISLLGVNLIQWYTDAVRAPFLASSPCRKVCKGVRVLPLWEDSRAT